MKVVCEHIIKLFVDYVIPDCCYPYKCTGKIPLCGDSK